MRKPRLLYQFQLQPMEGRRGRGSPAHGHVDLLQLPVGREPHVHGAVRSRRRFATSAALTARSCASIVDADLHPRKRYEPRGQGFGNNFSGVANAGSRQGRFPFEGISVRLEPVGQGRRGRKSVERRARLGYGGAEEYCFHRVDVGVWVFLGGGGRELPGDGG